MPKIVKPLSDEFLYPTTDNRPMAETDLHRKLIADLIDRLSARYEAAPDVYVSGNLLVYFEEDNPYSVLAPDCFVTFGVPPGDRDTYRLWDEGKLPDVVFEVTSKSTELEDRVSKFQTYQNEWRVREYFQFDPRAEYLDPPLIGHRLVRGRFTRLRPRGGVLTSRVLGLTVSHDGQRLILRDADTGAELLTAAERAEAEAARAIAAEERAAAAEAEVARLQAELAALKKKKPTA